MSVLKSFYIWISTELENNLNAPTTPAPNRLVYAVGVKLMNLAESFEAPEPGTVEFKNLAATISDSFNGVLNTIPGYYKTDILGFEKYVDQVERKSLRKCIITFKILQRGYHFNDC